MKRMSSTVGSKSGPVTVPMSFSYRVESTSGNFASPFAMDRRLTLGPFAGITKTDPDLSQRSPSDSTRTVSFAEILRL